MAQRSAGSGGGTGTGGRRGLIGDDLRLHIPCAV